MVTTRLYTTTTVEEEWSSLVGPWLHHQAREAWKSSKPTVVLTPSRAEGFYLRSRLLEEGGGFLGLRFWTPSDARKFLRAKLAPQLDAGTQAELRLMARAGAEKLLAQSSGENATLKSVLREPHAFLSAYDLLLGAGWDPALEGSVYGRALAHEMQQALDRFQMATQAGLHRHLRDKVVSMDEPLLAHLLVLGFNAAHWPLWDLLQAVVFAAEDAVLAFSAPRVFAEGIDQLWIGSWEELTGTEAKVPLMPMTALLSEEHPAPFANLVASYEKESPSHVHETDLTFLATMNLISHIRAVTLQALDYLKHMECTRLGIVFAEANALALGVAEELERLGIPLDDGTGALVPGIFERRCWQSWVALQEEPGVARLISWLRACEAQGVSFATSCPLSAREIADVLDNAFGESLIDDLDFLALYLEENASGNRSDLVAAFLRERIKLPESSPFAHFLALTRQAMTLPGWTEYQERLQIDPPGWLMANNEILSRRTFLEWLKDTTNSQVRARGAEGNHFYGKVHLVIYAQMTGQTWSHLILTGLNEGVWPRMYEAGAFGSRHELELLNRQARGLNRLSVEQGGQGMGHESVKAHGHCLLPIERQDLALRDLCAAIEGTTDSLCLTAMTTEAGRSLLPSDFFNHAYQAKSGESLDEETFRQIAIATDKWCHRHNLMPFHQASALDGAQASLAATAIAYRARRNPQQPFGPCEFAYDQPPPEPIQLSCKRWEDAWNHPSTVWLQEVVGASAWPKGMLIWSRAVGTWVHRWLAAALRKCQERNTTADFLSLLLEAADRELLRSRQRASAASCELYPWWEQVWAEARTVALSLGENLAPTIADHLVLAEYVLPNNLLIALPGAIQADFRLKGRIDLLLIQPGNVPYDLAKNDFSGCSCWVVDFKTGSASVLKAKKMEQGVGLQPHLYALAVQACGASTTAISFHIRDAALKPQVYLHELAGATELFRSLDKFHREGIFGMRNDAQNAYGYSPAYPIATQFINAPILKAKWALVHGGASPDEEEESE